MGISKSTMRLFLVIIFFCNILPKNTSAQIKEEVYFDTIYENMAMFNNGSLDDFCLWVYKNIKYPETAIKDSISGKVFARFMVDSTGIVKNVEIIRSVRWDLDAEVKRVLGLSPKWVPASQRGKNMGISFTIPINYDIKDPNFEKMITKLTKKTNKSGK